ncbi:MAG: glutamate--tRNA ligase [Candidatus Nanoarchaeia archaeon]
MQGHIDRRELAASIEKFALANAVMHGGKAQVGPIIGKLIAENANLRLHLKEIQPEIAKIVSKINKLSLSEQEAMLREEWPDFFEPKTAPKPKTLPPLANAIKGKVVMRFAPSPSGLLHLGGAYPLLLNSEYCKMYDGKLLLRLDDTDPERVELENYKAIEEDAKWITENNIDKVIVQSNRMSHYYKRAKEVLRAQHAYVCVCESKKWKKLMLKGRACPCRELPVSEQLKRWKQMLNGTIPAGGAVVRIKTNLQDPNPALRDWPALRICETPHPLQKKKYRVWPLMNFAVAVDDHELGITHSVRAKDHMDNERKQNLLQKKMGWNVPIGIHVARIVFTDIELSKRKLAAAIKAGKYTGWDDVRLATLKALKRRGYQPAALAKFYTIGIGLSQSDKKVSAKDFFQNLNALNRELIDKKANRYWFVPNPVKISIIGAPKVREVEAKLHPDKKAVRKIKVGKTIFVAKSDLEKFKGKEVRLMHLYNIVLGKKAKFTSEENKPIQKIQWVSDDNIKTEVLMPDGKIISGLAEANTQKLKIDDIIQFERFGFCRLDKKLKGKLIFCYAHN